MMIVDTETDFDPTAIPFMPPVEPDSRLKDPEKIAASILERTTKQRDTMPLVPAFCRLVAIGRTLPDETIDVMLCQNTKQEVAAITALWERWTIPGNHPVLFNAAFDIPVLVTRSILLGIPYPHISVRKYGSPDYTDLMLDLSFGGAVDYKSLDFWCARLGLNVPEDKTSGKDIAKMVADDDWTGIAAHCAVDIAKTLALAKRLGVR